MKRRIITLFAATVMVAGPVHAQDGEEGSPRVTPLAAQAMYNFAGCVVENSRSGVVKLLAKDYRTEEYREDIRKMAKGHDRCTPGNKLGFSGLIFAGNLAEHLLTNRFADAALSADLARDRSETPIEARSTTEAISMCIVMRAPKESVALFRTEVMSDAEKAVLTAIAPQLPNCVKQGTQFKTNRSGLRALLALAAYRIAVTSKTDAAG